LMMRVY